MIRPVRPLSYALDDDEGANKAVAWVVKNPGRADGLWAAMIEPDRIDQTYRALVQIIQNVQIQFAAQRAAVERAADDNRQGRISNAEFARLTVEHADWKVKITAFQAALQHQLQLTKAARHEINMRRNRAKEDQELRRLLKAITMAVQSHRESVRREYEPTAEDRLLWSRLELLRFDAGESLDEVAAKWAARESEGAA